MNYRVRWTKIAEADLMSIWLRSADQQFLADVAEKIDQILQHNPSDQGESRDPGWRLWFYRPFQVLFYVEETSNTVYVGSVKFVGR